MSVVKDSQLQKFKNTQEQLRSMASKCPHGIQNWDYVKTVHYKNVMKDCEKFIKLKPTDDDKQFIRMDNKLTDLKRFYN